jgi:hypothetical protein
MRQLKLIPRAGASLLFLTVSLSLSFISCGGGSTASPSVSTPTSGAPTAPAPAPPTGTGAAPPPTAPPTGNANAVVLTDLHKKSGWTGYALLRSENYSICTPCVPGGPGATWSMVQDVATPSVSGSSSKFEIGGSTAFSDILWNNHLMGDFSSQNLPDKNKTLVPSLHHFIYDVYFYAGDLSVSQALEFDINQFFGGESYIWGHECRIAGGHEWDTWNNVDQHWVKSGIACNPKSNDWNHLVIEVERTDDNQLLFKSITLNDDKAVLNRYDDPKPRKNWYGVTINYQQDGDRNQAGYSIWLDKVNFSYW